MAKKSMELPRRIVCQQILRRFSLAHRRNDRRSQIGLAHGVASAFAAEWVEADRRSAASKPSMAAKRVSDTRVRGELHRRTFQGPN